MQNLSKHMKPLLVAVALSVGATGGMVQTAQAGIGKKLVGAAVVGGVAHHYYKKHKMKKRARQAAQQQQMQQPAQTPMQPAPAAH